MARCFRGRTCPYRLRDACWFSHDDDPEEDPPCRDVAATSCRVVAVTALDGLAGRIRRLERIVEQIGGVLVPQALQGDVDGLVEEQIRAVPVPHIWEPIVDGPHLVPQVRVQNRTPEQVMDIPVPQIMEDSLPLVLQERVQNCTREQIVDVLVPQITEDSSPGVPQDYVQNCTPEQIVDVPVPQFMEDSSPLVPQERVQNRTPEQIVVVPVPQIMEDCLPFVPQARVQNRTREQIVDVLVPQITEDGLPIVPQERVQNRTPEQIVDSPVPQIMEEGLPIVPQERVQNRTPEQIVDFPVPQIIQESVQNRTLEQVRVHSRIQEQIMDLPVPQIMVTSKAFTGKVFTVGMRHHRGDQACLVDTLGFNIKGLDRFTLLRSGDVMVPPLPMVIPVPQIAEEIVERTLPSLHEAVTRFFEQHASEDGLISWETLEATLPPGLLRESRRRAQELTALEEDEEEQDEEEGEEQGEILAST